MNNRILQTGSMGEACALEGMAQLEQERLAAEHVRTEQVIMHADMALLMEADQAEARE